MIFVVLCGSLTLENKTKPCVTHKMIIAVRISSPHDCHTVQHREHFLRLHGIITSQSAPRGMSIGHTAPEAISILSGYLNLQNRAENWGTYLGSVKAKAMAIYLDT